MTKEATLKSLPFSNGHVVAPDTLKVSFSVLPPTNSDGIEVMLGRLLH